MYHVKIFLGKYIVRRGSGLNWASGGGVLTIWWIGFHNRSLWTCEEASSTQGRLCAMRLLVIVSLDIVGMKWQSSQLPTLSCYRVGILNKYLS